ncbi:OTU domain-containing protein 5-like [Ylistrum balloti]|uniref:OTU domain-containing protein 5-like n=1 Tax=Ylistrum balloti TaxID=509963 RepID=UPI002905D776|nr:OTU domain-containing protein 5-like [Ylistrum balloti]
MTILPKKKSTKDKNEVESADHSKGHHPSTPENRHDKVNRTRSSPTRWLPSTSRDDNTSTLEAGCSYEGHEPAPGHNKRRHRSSPHRNVRKHRGHGQGGASPSREYDEEGYNSEDEYNPPSYPTDNIDELERLFDTTMKDKKGWIIKKMAEDGACLFRAVADQVYGDQEMHTVVRKLCVDYMGKNEDYFSQYVTEDFHTYLNRKKMDHCHGNHVEMQAISEVFNRPIEVYQYSIEPINTFSCTYKTENEPIRISYHRNTHYNSCVDPYKATIGVGLGLPGFQPGLADKNLMGDAVKQSEKCHLEKCMLEDKLRETDWEVTQETIEEQVARESYLQWLRDNETQARRQDTPKSASATCSSSSDAMYMNTPSDLRVGRSPRARSNPNSAQNSPQRPEGLDQASPQPTLPTVGGGSPHPPSDRSMLGAAGGEVKGAMGGSSHFQETSSLMNQYPSNMFGYPEWNEDDILAQVMAQSQQEYFDSLKKNATASSSGSSSSFTFSPTSSSSWSDPSSSGHASLNSPPSSYQGPHS